MTNKNNLKPDVYSERVIEREVSNSVEIGSIRLCSPSTSIKELSKEARILFDHANSNKSKSVMVG